MSAPSHSFDDDTHSSSAIRRARRRPGENRERLLTAGVAVFGSHGFHGASTASIAALAGVPQPHVYANFQTKQELFLECARKVSTEIIQSSFDGSPQAMTTSGHAAFLLQSLAAFQEEVLQPELSDLILELTDVVSSDVVLALISKHISATLSNS